MRTGGTFNIYPLINKCLKILNLFEVMATNIAIDGDRYFGRFEVQEHSSTSTSMVDCEFAQHPQTSTHTWYEGKGMINNQVAGRRERFMFYPKGVSILDVIPYLAQEDLRDKSKVDGALDYLFRQAEGSSDVIPVVKLERV